MTLHIQTDNNLKERWDKMRLELSHQKGHWLSQDEMFAWMLDQCEKVLR